MQIDKISYYALNKPTKYQLSDEISNT